MKRVVFSCVQLAGSTGVTEGFGAGAGPVVLCGVVAGMIVTFGRSVGSEGDVQPAARTDRMIASAIIP